MRQRVGLQQKVHFIPEKENLSSSYVSREKKKKKSTKEEAAKALFRKQEEKGQKSDFQKKRNF